MSYDLRAKNKDVKDMSVGAFTWPIFLQDTGMGYVLGYGAGMRPGSYVYQNGNNGSPASNDGYKVTATEAKMMAKVARGYISVQRFVNKEWDELPPEDRKEKEEWEARSQHKIYRTKVHEDHLKKLEQIADFMEKSGGFTIN
jgi:hypothetical protein